MGSSVVPGPGHAVRSRTATLPSSRRRIFTLVKGRELEHIPGGLPEPLKSALRAWQASFCQPQTPETTRWHRRMLQFWKLSTDNGRFMDTGQDDAGAPPWKGLGGQEVALTQRPYTAPAHRMAPEQRWGDMGPSTRGAGQAGNGL